MHSARFGQQAALRSLKEADAENFYENSFQLQDNKSPASYNKDGIWSNLTAMYEMGKRCSSKEVNSRAPPAETLPQVSRNATAEVPVRDKVAGRYAGSRRVKRLSTNPYSKGVWDDLIFKSYEASHCK